MDIEIESRFEKHCFRETGLKRSIAGYYCESRRTVESLIAVGDLDVGKTKAVKTQVCVS